MFIEVYQKIEGGLDNIEAIVKHFLKEKLNPEDYIVGEAKNDKDKFVFTHTKSTVGNFQRFLENYSFL